MDIEATIKLIYEHLEVGDVESARHALDDARDWIRKGGSVTPQQYDSLRKANAMILAHTS
jgi:hypothetical protein